MKFNEWFENNLIIGSFPYRVNELFSADDYDVVINVSDEFYGDIYDKLRSEGVGIHWFPMNETKKDIGLNCIYGAMVVLRLAEKNNCRVYLHCHSGTNRSRGVQAAYFYMRTGRQYEPEIRRNSYVNALLAMCHRGYLPPKAEMEQFLSMLAKSDLDRIPADDYQGGLLDTIKVDTINNF